MKGRNEGGAQLRWSGRDLASTAFARPSKSMLDGSSPALEGDRIVRIFQQLLHFGGADIHLYTLLWGDY